MLAIAAISAALVSAAAAAEIAVSVGAFANGTAGLVFDPASITAAIGDTVVFTFHPKNHSVTQSSFAAPCTKLPVNTTTGTGGFTTGFHPATATDASLTTVTIQVNQTAPIWFFCGQTNHCSSGMVGAINAPATGNTFDAYLANAKAVPAVAVAGASGSAVASGAAGASATGATPATGSTAPAAGAASSVRVGGALAGALIAGAAAFVSLA